MTHKVLPNLAPNKIHPGVPNHTEDLTGYARLLTVVTGQTYTVMPKCDCCNQTIARFIETRGRVKYFVCQVCVKLSDEELATAAARWYH